MKFSILAVALFASTTLVSVTSAAVNGGVRGSGSIDQTQTRRSLEPDCAGCGDDKSFYVDGATGGCLVKQRTDRDKCKTIEISWRKDALTKYECGIFQSIGWADGWCPYDFQDGQNTINGAPLRGFGDVCEEDCHAAYRAAGADGVGGVPGSGRSECNDDEFALYPNYCTLRTCVVEC